MKTPRIFRHWQLFLLVLALAAITGKAAYAYWVDRVETDWNMAFERSVTVAITGLEPPLPLLEPIPIPEELEIIEPLVPEASGEEAEILPEDGAAEPGDNDGGSGDNAGGGSVDGSGNSSVPPDDAGSGAAEPTEAEEPGPGVDNLPQDGAADPGVPGENTPPEPGATGGSAESGSGDSPAPDHAGSDAGIGSNE